MWTWKERIFFLVLREMVWPFSEGFEVEVGVDLVEIAVLFEAPKSTLPSYSSLSLVLLSSQRWTSNGAKPPPPIYYLGTSP